MTIIECLFVCANKHEWGLEKRKTGISIMRLPFLEEVPGGFEPP